MTRPICFFLIAASALAADSKHWVATWGASPAPQYATEEQIRKAKLFFENQTLREIVHVSLGGDSVRVRLSNAYGKQSIEIGAAQIALRGNGAGIAAGSSHALTFSGRSSISIPPDAVVISDPVSVNLPPASDLAISLFLPKATPAGGIHYSSQQTSYYGPGDLTSASTISEAQTIKSWVFLTGVDVLAPQSAATLVAFGDSITDGARSTLDANHRWPDILASRLQHAHKKIGVVDAGIGGNRILHDAGAAIPGFGMNALARFDRDVIAVPGVKYVIILEGINDLGHAGSSAPESETVSAEDLIAGMRQLIERAHEKGIKIYGGAITPFEGTVSKGYFTPEKEAKRKAINEWIRTSHSFDGVVDFEKAIRDPEHPDRMLATYDGGDHLHPGDAGYKAMGEAVDLALFK